MLELLGAGLKTDETRRFENHYPQKLNMSSMRHRRVVVEANLDQVYWSLNALGLHRKKEETAGAHIGRKRPQAPGKTVDFKTADLRGFRSVADSARHGHRTSGSPSLLKR